MRDRFWIRGWTWLGLLNTAFAITCGRVLCRIRSDDSGQWRTVGWDVRKASDFPRPRQ